MDISNGESQVQIVLKTKQPEYAVSDVPYTIDGTVTTNELNIFVNALLEGAGGFRKPMEFDFIVMGEYLRGRLCDHLREKEISFEDNIEIEYVERFPAPEPQDCLLHDDWVSTVSTCNKWILTGCYDNTVNIWNTKGEHLLTIPGHTMPLKAVSWVSVSDEYCRFVSCGQDQIAMLWDWSVATNSVECVSMCKGHERCIDAVGVSPDEKRFATGGWDTMLKVWSTDINDAAEVSSKRAKADVVVKTPQMTLQGHRECVSALQWIDNSTILSGSWDHTMKIWDLNLEGIKSDITTNKSIFDASYSKLNHLVITASADKTVRLHDLRASRGSVLRNSYLGHGQWVLAVMWSTTEEYLFVSGGYDHQNKLWDYRSPKAPLYDLIGHDDKVLAIDWSNPKYIVSGGEDNTVRVFKSKNIQADNMDTKSNEK